MNLKFNSNYTTNIKNTKFKAIEFTPADCDEETKAFLKSGEINDFKVVFEKKKQ